jgi:protein involved in polysaccharide export with SLBB domain
MLLLLAAVAPASAQRTSGNEPAVAASATATRAALTAALADAERRGDRASASGIRRRLTEGDVGPGDRLVVTLTLDTIASYEVVVRDSQRVEIPALGAFSLRGVLRSELPEAFRRFYLQYYRNPDVRVQSLVRVGFLGAVQKPGYYNLPPDAPVAEAFLTNAGGPPATATRRRSRSSAAASACMTGRVTSA